VPIKSYFLLHVADNKVNYLYVPSNGMKFKKELSMNPETEEQELEIIDEGEENTDEVNACCASVQARK
jgi:predicted P-loop ATPase/GTPase